MPRFKVHRSRPDLFPLSRIVGGLNSYRLFASCYAMLRYTSNPPGMMGSDQAGG
jgi:hypothetical protein